MPIQTAFYPLRGGLNLITPAVETPPGHSIASLNHEASERGYQRMPGYERFDGRPKPSEATYWIQRFDVGTATIAQGATVTGATSAATAVAVRAMVVQSGAFGDSDAAGYLVLTQRTGAFQDNENLQVGGVTKCVADGTMAERGALVDDEDRAWLQASIEMARTLIVVPAGSGPIRGGFTYDGDTYCFRDNAGGTAGVLFKATTAGWVAQALGRVLAFTSGGTYVVAEGDTITGATSAATAVITRVVVHSGDWTTNNAAGYLIFASQTGTFQAENLNVGANLDVATIAGNSSANALPPLGRYECVEHNFFGASNLKRIYGVSGKGRGFEWDGTVFVPINTGLSDALDKPLHVAAHKNHLFFSFAGGSIQFSGVGDPYAWSVILGAGEIGLGEEVTAMLASVSSVLAIYGRRKVAVLYGSDASDFALQELSNDSGAQEWTVQQMGTPIHLDNGGLRSLEVTSAFGDFKRGSLTRQVDPLLRAIAASGIAPVASMRSRSRDLYRLFWSDGRGLSVYFGRKAPESMPIQLTHVPVCTWVGEDEDGHEVAFFGDANGMVYQLDSGTSHDGTAVPAYIRLPFNHVGSPTQRKRFSKITLETDAGPGTRLGLTAEFSYADPDQPPVQEFVFTNRSSEAFTWDQSLWDEMSWPSVDQGLLEDQGAGGFYDEDDLDRFFWSSPAEGVVRTHISGVGTNISVVVMSDGTYAQPYTLHGLILHYSLRGLVR